MGVLLLASAVSLLWEIQPEMASGHAVLTQLRVPVGTSTITGVATLSNLTQWAAYE